MALNPAFVSHSSRPLPLAFGYVLGSGDKVLAATTAPTVAQPQSYAAVLNLLGEGEWDGVEMFSQASEVPLLNDVRDSTEKNILANAYLHFHRGSYTTKGAGNAMISTGLDQLCDEWYNYFPRVSPPQSYSGIAYMLVAVPTTEAVWFPRGNLSATAFPVAPTAIFRALRCRIFDDYGNVTGYGFTTNPAWHFVEATLRLKIKPQQPGLAGLTDAEKACFNWEAIAETSSRNAYILPNGRPRFVGSYVFAAGTTLTNVHETILRVSRSYTRLEGGQIYLIGDDPRASVFLMGANHIVPGTLKLAKKNVAKAPNQFIPRFRDIDIPAVCEVESVVRQVVSLNGVPVNYYLFTLSTLSPFVAGDIASYGGSSDESFNGPFTVLASFTNVAGITDTPNQVRCKGEAGGSFAGSATGGFMGTNNARFSERAPTNIQHRSHQRRVAMQAPGLSVQPSIVPVEYDCGNCTFDQTNRLMKFERDRSLGTDTGAGWTAPIAGTLTARLEAVDVNGVALIGVQVHDVITLDDWVTAEFPGDYEVMDPITITPPSGEDLGEIVLQLAQYNRNAYTDVSDDPGESYATVPSVDLPFGTFPLTTPGWVLEATPQGKIDPVSDKLTITAPDLSIQWGGKVNPTLYPAAQWTGLTPGGSYVLYLDDADGSGAAATYASLAGNPPLADMPPGRIIVLYGVFNANNYVNIDLQTGAAAFFSGTGTDHTTFALPSTPASDEANLLAWASPQGFTGGGAHLHFIQTCGTDSTRLLQLVYNDSAGTIWDGPLNFAALTWNATASVVVSGVGAMRYVELTLAGGEEVCFGWGVLPSGTGIPFPTGYTIDKSILMAFPSSASDSGNPAHGVRAYVDPTGHVHHDYQDGSGNKWSGPAQALFFGWKNNKGTVTKTDGWVTIPLSTGRTFAVGGFSVVDQRISGAPPTNYPSSGLMQILTGGKLPLPTGLSAATLQAIPCPDSFQITGNDAHGVNESLVDASLNVRTSFKDGSGNVWYGSSAAFALLNDTPSP